MVHSVRRQVRHCRCDQDPVTRAQRDEDNVSGLAQASPPRYLTGGTGGDGGAGGRRGRGRRRTRRGTSTSGSRWLAPALLAAPSGPPWACRISRKRIRLPCRTQQLNRLCLAARWARPRPSPPRPPQPLLYAPGPLLGLPLFADADSAHVLRPFSRAASLLGFA